MNNSIPCDECGFGMVFAGGESPYCLDCHKKHQKSILTCSLCFMTFEKDDSDLKHRLERHTIWHEKARIQKRNTTQGVPRYD